MIQLFYNLGHLIRGISLAKWRPIHLVQVGERHFRGANDDPQFVIERRFYSGWYVWELQIDNEHAELAKLYLDLGEGFTEAHVVTLPFQNPAMRKRFFFIPPNCRAIRFDPVESQSTFQILHFKIRRVMRGFAQERIVRKLQQIGFKTRGDVALDELMVAYGELFSLQNRIGYQDYIQEVEPTLRSSQIADEHIQFSVLMPVYNPDIGLLQEAVESVLNQSYSNLEFCIADDASTKPEIREYLEGVTKRDKRVKVVFRKENGHISRASNSALALCTGDFVALIDHDDCLVPHALNEVAKVIAQNPDCNIVYSDEDKMDEAGNRRDAHFKPDWNYHLLLSQNYVSHLGVYRRTLMQEVEGFRAGYEGSQDYDLLLRCVKACNGNGIHHIPQVLYHWRIVQGSTAMAAAEKDYTTRAGLRALTDYMADQPGVEVTQAKFPNMYRVKWPLPEKLPMVSLIIPTRNGKMLTKQAIDSILEKTTYSNYEILLVDNDSDDKDALAYFASLEESYGNSHPRVRVLRYPHPFNYSAINNFAVQHAEGELVGLINNDIEIINSDWLDEMVSHAVRHKIGCVGAKLYFPDGKIQHAGVYLGVGGVAGHCHRFFFAEHGGYFGRMHVVQNISAVTAAAMLVKKSIYEEVGGLDEENLKVAFNDVDFCLKVLKAGYQNLWTPYAELVHHESVSRGKEDSPEKLERFKGEISYMQETWGELLGNDPHYNPNLTLERSDFSLRTLTK